MVASNKQKNCLGVLQVQIFLGRKGVPKCSSPQAETTSKTPPSRDSKLTSRVPPPKSYTRMLALGICRGFRVQGQGSRYSLQSRTKGCRGSVTTTRNKARRKTGPSMAPGPSFPTPPEHHTRGVQCAFGLTSCRPYASGRAAVGSLSGSNPKP